jgi:hypothetical protein
VSETLTLPHYFQTYEFQQALKGAKGHFEGDIMIDRLWSLFAIL